MCLYLQDTHKTLGSLALMELFTHTHICKAEEREVGLGGDQAAHNKQEIR